ncbi:hypothetical protein SAMN02745823_03813 [Sporobacter termitidis DSM 10068]|uniref:Bacteriophage holin of superfamily 6 (Holin_LLH) n=1 Tax=Sporobacter termitidis DSM 10068 TaxID=1123282 RepID=A0A1M5ZJ92_9FIRM|nr:hypothetical protein [Sporobacter termitidis]SHI24199.1 hypothetical protein SAMN02745823_03813 [Sporobacter termitidis DSM 10068]
METVLEVFKLLIIPICMSIFGAYIKWRFDKHDKADKERNEARVKKETLMLRGINAAAALGDATAECMQSLAVDESGKVTAFKCNGNVKAAREYAANVKHELRDFMDEQGVQNLI